MSTRDISFAGNAPPFATWIAFSALCVGMFMAVLDIQIVATSLPTIEEGLGIRRDQMSWIQTCYLIAEVIAIPLTGLLTHALTMRWLAVATLVAFTIASIGCATSDSFAALIVWRTFQGFAGGLLIPQVFAAGIVLFSDRGQILAMTIASVLAVLAPAVGPYIGGWITSTYDWPWLFLINIGPGLLAAAIAAGLLPREQTNLKLLHDLDLKALVLMAIALASLEIGLKEAPLAGWYAIHVVAFFAVSLIAGTLFITRSLTSARPLVDLRTFGRREFALGAALSFILGVGLYGSVYLMPVFLAFVRNHDAIGIGEIVIITGLAQLAMAPIAVWLEKYSSARAMTVLGFTVFAAGLGLSAFQTRATDYIAMFGPQVIRGAAIMLCLLPPIRLALTGLPKDAIANASGLFNLMRNLGGAIGLALIDTVIYGRGPVIGEALGEKLAQGDVETAKAIGLPLQQFLAHVPGTPLDPSAEAYVRVAIERQAVTMAINEAWALVAILTLAGALAVLIIRPRIRVAEPEQQTVPQIPHMPSRAKIERNSRLAITSKARSQSARERAESEKSPKEAAANM